MGHLVIVPWWIPASLWSLGSHICHSNLSMRSWSPEAAGRRWVALAGSSFLSAFHTLILRIVDKDVTSAQGTLAGWGENSCQGHCQSLFLTLLQFPQELPDDAPGSVSNKSFPLSGEGGWLGVRGTCRMQISVGPAHGLLFKLLLAQGRMFLGTGSSGW